MYALGHVYIASQYERKEEMRNYRDHLWTEGITVTSRWIDNTSQDDGLGEEALAGKHWLGIGPALIDTEDIALADTFIMFTSNGGRGGYHTELGIALAMRKEIFLIGKRQNVFHCLSNVQVFPDWESFMKWIKER
jgi:hypothetical protein